MEVRSPKIAQAAISVISRYGLRKTTMSDLAEAAGVSRQTIYNIYANRDEVVADAVRFGYEQSIETVERAWEQDETFSAKLDSFFNAAPLSWYDLMQSTPDAADLFDGLNNACTDEFAAATSRWTSALTEVLTPFAGTLAKSGLAPEDVADLIYTTSSSAKHTAENRDQLVKRLATLKASVLALVQAA